MTFSSTRLRFKINLGSKHISQACSVRDHFVISTPGNILPPYAVRSPLTLLANHQDMAAFVAAPPARGLSCHPRSHWLCSSTTSSRHSAFLGPKLPALLQRPISAHRPPSDVARASFGGGFFGVGTGEVVVILAVGWLLLGPEKLYAVAKDTGKLIGSLRRTATDAQKTFTDALDYEMIKADFEKGVAEETGAGSSDKTGKNISPQEGDPADGDEGAAMPNEDDVAVEAAAQDGEQFTELPFAPSKEGPAGEDGAETGQSAVGSAFLDQLKRVSDPDQAPPSVPDLDSSLEFDKMEVARLEAQYLEARERLQARQELNDSASIEEGAEATRTSEQPSDSPDVKTKAE